MMELAALIDAFVGDDGDIGPWDWDNFTSSRFSDPEMEAVRVHCASLQGDYPPYRYGPGCSVE
jgi:hypothetical protein